MCVGENEDADREKLVFTWKARRDAYMTAEGELHYRAAEVDTVFFVLVTPNGRLSEFPDIFGWAEHWGWLPEAANLSGAPVDYQTRYDIRLWTGD
jgi:hypothetical protein